MAAAELRHASDETRLMLWNGYFRHLYAKKASYQFQDFEIVDYGLCASGTLGMLRGPRLSPAALESGNYICLVGAAQFFGRLVPIGLQELIARRFGVPVLNLSFGGAGPQSFLNEHVASLLRKAKLVVVQVMSGRSVGCDEYPGGMTTRRKDTGERVNRELLLLELAQQEPAGVHAPGRKVAEIVRGSIRADRDANRRPRHSHVAVQEKTEGLVDRVRLGEDGAGHLSANGHRAGARGDQAAFCPLCRMQGAHWGL